MFSFKQALKENNVHPDCITLLPSDRETEFIGKLKGMNYAEIAANGGGILNSVKKLNDEVSFNFFTEFRIPPPFAAISA